MYMGASDIRQIEIHAAELFICDPNLSETEIAIG
jgi:hypothetical protein